MRLPYPEGYAYHHIELQSSAEPYGLTIYLTGSREVASEDFDICSDLAFDLIGNLGWIKFQGIDNPDVNVTFSRQAGDALSESDPIRHTNPAIADSTTADARNQLPAPEIDYGTSSLYSREDMDAAIEVILTEFSTWEGCELHSIRYTSDDCNSPEHIRWLNELNEAAEGDRKLDVTFTQCIEFVSDYHSPKDSDLAGAWNVDEEYEDWQWWLGRSEQGEWHLMGMGY
jgi:D-alanyl-D-alanine carboxypeptidase